MAEKLADYSQPVTIEQLDGALHAGAFDGVWHYFSGTPGFVLRLESVAIVQAMRQRGWAQGGIDVPFNPWDADGHAAVTAAQNYGFPAGTKLALDIEPVRFQAAPSVWPVAADAWCDVVRTGGYVPVVYGTDVTVAACANHADYIWRAEPGDCDPESPGIGGLAASFFTGRRASQCATEVQNGIEFDVSISEFSLIPSGPGRGGSMADVLADLDLNAPGVQAVFNRIEGISWGFAEAVQPVPNQGEAMIRLRSVDNNAYQALLAAQATQALVTKIAGEDDQLVQLVTAQGTTLAAVKSSADALTAAVAQVEQQIASAQPVDLTALKAELDGLTKHLGVGTP